MRRLALIVLALAAFTGAASGAPQPPGPLTAFVVAGGGWGHGVGMSQWGAYGQAKAGRSYQQILGYYYRGTELGNAPASLLEKVRVLVRGDLGSVSVSSSAPIVVIDAGGKRYRLDATLTVEPKLELPVGKAGAVVPLTGPLTLRPAADANLVFGGKAYRGELQLTKIDGRLQLVNALGLEAYLLGVVPGEMPKHWPLEALKAQAVAARTYAVAHLAKGKSYDLFSDYRSQLYYGVGAEASGPSQAVRETRGQILTYEGRAAQTLYFSSSGGHTISALDAFGWNIPYLVAVDDPWDETSPNHAWTAQLLNGSELGKKFGLQGAVVDVTYVPGTPGKPAVVRLTTADGVAKEVRLSDVRGRLGLKSTGFRLGLLRLDRPATVANGVLTLTGVARDVADPVLEQRVAGGGWVLVKRLTTGANGAFSVKLKLSSTTVYRLASGELGGPPLAVRVAA